MAEPGVRATFFKKAALHEGKSKEAGRQVYVDKDYIEIRVAGMDKSVHIAPVNDSHKARFPDEWERYQKGADVKREGTPVRCWPEMTPSQVASLEALNIFTVEDMATAPEFALQKIGMGAREMQKSARRFLSLAQAAADVGQMDELKSTNESQAAQIKALQDQVAALMKAVTPAATDEPPPPVVQEERPRRRKAAE